MEENAAESIDLVAQFGPVGAALVVVLYGVFVLVFFGGFMWMGWKMMRAHYLVPKELKGIRFALERIADQLENKD